AIGRDLADTAAALEADWAEVHAPDMRVAGAPAARIYLDAEEPVRDLFTALLTGARTTIDNRLGGPLGTWDRPRPHLAEAWRSGRPLRNAGLSVAALRRLAACFAPALPAPDAADLDAAWARAQEVVDRAPRPMVEALGDPGRRFAIEAARQAVIDAREKTERLLAPALDLSVSFNALDGD
ncbi:MAG: imelysin family protein, partial [Pseudomonadota bacterium]|nr:imelysin family protein [Pseudomonadota bacterium]